MRISDLATSAAAFSPASETFSVAASIDAPLHAIATIISLSSPREPYFFLSDLVFDSVLCILDLPSRPTQVY